LFNLWLFARVEMLSWPFLFAELKLIMCHPLALAEFWHILILNQTDAKLGGLEFGE
tara:strand:- start:201 stop:368 length:168 start_codon:yes stop_codon:yes gene_type:complete